MLPQRIAHITKVCRMLRYSRSLFTLVIVAEERSQFVCKFFKYGNCKAGSSCLYSHDLSGKKQICFWFQKGSCRYGHMCALAHILPGEDISMDWKHKEAARLAAEQLEKAGESGGGPTAIGDKSEPPQRFGRGELSYLADGPHCANCGRLTDGTVHGVYCSRDCHDVDTALTSGNTHHSSEGGPSSKMSFPPVSPLRNPSVVNHSHPIEGQLSGWFLPRPYQQPIRAPQPFIPLPFTSSPAYNQAFRQPYRQHISRPYSPSVESHAGSSDIFSQRSESTQPTEYSEPSSPCMNSLSSPSQQLQQAKESENDGSQRWLNRAS